MHLLQHFLPSRLAISEAKILHNPFSFVMWLPPFSLILPTLPMFRLGELVQLPHPPFYLLLSSVAGWSLALAPLLGV